MPREFLNLTDVSFTYDALSGMLIKGLSVTFPKGWTGVAGANGSGKSTLLKLATGKLISLKGRIASPGLSIYCEQRTDTPPEMLQEFIDSYDADSISLRDILNIKNDWPDRWETLSHGERKRAHIGVALWKKPEVLALDEPANHIDFQAKQMLLRSLVRYDGIGLIVSHDRELLDELCSQCLFVDPHNIVMRPGNYTRSLAQEKMENEAVLKNRLTAKQEYIKLKHEASTRRREASAADKKRSKSGIGKNDHDAKSKIDLARVTGKDATAGKLLNQIQGRLDLSAEKIASFKVKKEYSLGIWIQSEKCRRDFLFRSSVDRIALSDDRNLFLPNLAIRPEDRIGISGPNGAGKSTIIRYIMNTLKIPAERITYIPQEINLTETSEIIRKIKTLPRQKLGHVMTVVSCLGSRPERLFESTEPSPGETRKLLLALGISYSPWIIIMDEPTNHMDLPSINCLEDALNECNCALLLVSHDTRFLNTLAEISWHISINCDGNSRLNFK